MKKKRGIQRLVSVIICLIAVLSLMLTASAAEIRQESAPQTGSDGLILILSAVAITGLVVLIAIRWGKRKFFE